MDEREDESMEDFLVLPEESRQTSDDDPHRPGTSSDSKFQLMNIILCGVGVLIIVLLIITFWVRGDEATKEDISQIQAMVSLLEQRVNRLEGMESQISQLEDLEKRLQGSMAESDKSGKSVAHRLDAIDKRLNAMREIIISVEARADAQLAAQKETGAQDNRRYHVVRRGETLYRIAKKNGLSVQEICRQNNITPDQAIHPGQRLLVASGSRQ